MPALRVYIKNKVTISNDNSGNPQDIVHGTGDKEFVDTATYNEGTSKSLKVAPSTTDEQVDLDNITSVAILSILTDSADVSVKIVPTGSVLADVVAMKLLPNVPFTMGSDIAEIYVSNASATDSAKVKIGAAGN